MISIESDIESLNIFDTDAIQRLQSSFKAAKIGSTKSSCHLTRECRKHPNKNIDKLDALNLDACFWNATNIHTNYNSMGIYEVDVLTNWSLSQMEHRVWYPGLSTYFSKNSNILMHSTEAFLWNYTLTDLCWCHIRKLWKIHEEVPPNVLRFGIANLLLAPLSCQKHGPPRTHEGQARKSHSSRLLKRTLDYSSDNSFMKFRSSGWTFWCTALRSFPNFRFRRMSHIVSSQLDLNHSWPECLKVLFHRPGQNKSTQDCSVGSQSTYQVHGLSVPAVDQKLRNSTSARWFEVTFFDSFALFWSPYLHVTCWSYGILLSLLLFKGSQKRTYDI